MILRWHLTWNASSCFVSACRMAQVSELYILTPACRMAQVSELYILTPACRMAQVSELYILTPACRMALVSELNILTPACRMVLVSEPYMLASAWRMIQASKPCIHTDHTKHAYAKLKTSELWRQGETHLYDWGRSLLKLHYRSDALCLVWNIRATPVLTRDRSPRKISDSINDVSIHIDLCIKWFSSKVLNLGFSARMHSFPTS